MASRRMLTDTVVLENYVGEVNDVASYEKTVLRRCSCQIHTGANIGSFGREEGDSGKLYIFDFKTKAESTDGKPKSYMPYDQWKSLDDKSPYWTISDKGNDRFSKEGVKIQFRIAGFKHLTAGSRRMWHFEVNGV